MDVAVFGWFYFSVYLQKYKIKVEEKLLWLRKCGKLL